MVGKARSTFYHERMSLHVDEAKLRNLCALCREHGIVRLDMFGSAARADFDPARSDVDLVVDFAPDRTPGIAFFGLHRHFEAILGRPVDLLTRAMLDDRIRDSALHGAVTLYDAA